MNRFTIMFLRECQSYIMAARQCLRWVGGARCNWSGCTDSGQPNPQPIQQSAHGFALIIMSQSVSGIVRLIFADVSAQCPDVMRLQHTIAFRFYFCLTKLLLQSVDSVWMLLVSIRVNSHMYCFCRSQMQSASSVWQRQHDQLLSRRHHLRRARYSQMSCRFRATICPAMRNWWS